MWCNVIMQVHDPARTSLQRFKYVKVQTLINLLETLRQRLQHPIKVELIGVNLPKYYV